MSVASLRFNIHAFIVFILHIFQDGLDCKIHYKILKNCEYKVIVKQENVHVRKKYDLQM